MELNRVKNNDLTQIAKKSIYDYIKSIDLKESNKLPREEILAQKLGVSRITVRSALNELATEGIIFRRQGKGTFINREAAQIKVTFNPAEDLKQAIISSGYEVTIKNLQVQTCKPTEDDAKKLQISMDNNIICMEKIFYANGQPAIYCIDKIPEKFLVKSVKKSDYKVSIYQFIAENLNKKVTWDKVEIATVTNKDKDALKKYFYTGEIKPLLHCDVINFDKDDTPVFYAQEYIDTTFVRFNLIRQKKTY